MSELILSPAAALYMFLPFPLEISPVQDVFYCICKTTKILYRTWLTIARPKTCAVLDFSLDISKLEAEGEKRRLWLSLLLLGKEPTSLWRWLVSNHSPHTSSHLSTWERLTCSHIVGFQDSRVEMSVLGVDLCPNPIQRQLVLTWPITSVPIFLFLSLLFPCPVMSSRLSSPESRISTCQDSQGSPQPALGHTPTHLEKHHSTIPHYGLPCLLKADPEVAGGTLSRCLQICAFDVFIPNKSFSCECQSGLLPEACRNIPAGLPASTDAPVPPQSILHTAAWVSFLKHQSYHPSAQNLQGLPIALKLKSIPLAHFSIGLFVFFLHGSKSTL